MTPLDQASRGKACIRSTAPPAISGAWNFGVPCPSRVQSQPSTTALCVPSPASGGVECGHLEEFKLLRDAEVGDLEALVHREEEVPGLDVLVHHALSPRTRLVKSLHPGLGLGLTREWRYSRPSTSWAK